MDDGSVESFYWHLNDDPLAEDEATRIDRMGITIYDWDSRDGVGYCLGRKALFD